MNNDKKLQNEIVNNLNNSHIESTEKLRGRERVA